MRSVSSSVTSSSERCRWHQIEQAVVAMSVVSIRPGELASSGIDCWRKRIELHVPATSTVHAILRRHQLIDPTESAKHRALATLRARRPNRLWQMDFKGHFPIERRLVATR